MNIQGPTSPVAGWLDDYVWPQIETMMSNDALFKLLGRARELSGKFNGPISGLMESGYVTSQMVAIRRLCDPRKDVISLRRVLLECKAKQLTLPNLIDQLLSRLDRCDYVCELVNSHVAHTANPLRGREVRDWKLEVGQLADAQRAVCEVAIALDRDLLRRKNRVSLIPTPQYDIMEEFRCWISDEAVNALWDFWHAHNRSVNDWISTARFT
jgi:hypothetical protein